MSTTQKPVNEKSIKYESCCILSLSTSKNKSDGTLQIHALCAVMSRVVASICFQQYVSILFLCCTVFCRPSTFPCSVLHVVNVHLSLFKLIICRNGPALKVLPVFITLKSLKAHVVWHGFLIRGYKKQESEVSSEHAILETVHKYALCSPGPYMFMALAN